MSGASGSGKTTLLRQLKPAIAPYGKRQGAVLYEGRPVEELEKRRAALEIWFVFQSPDAQIVTDRVSSELAFGLENAGVPPEEIRRRVAEMAGFFGIEGWYHKAIEALSGGQRQMLNLASVMVMNPKVLILDEPTSQLDPLAAGDFLATLRKINAELGTTIILIEHRLEEVLSYADRVMVMENGGILALAPPRKLADLIRDNDMFQAMPVPMRIFEALDGRGDCPVTVREGREWLKEQIPDVPVYREGEVADAEKNMESVEASAGKKTRKKFLFGKKKENSEGSAAGGETVLEAKDVWFRYEKDLPDVVRDLNFTVKKGELFCLLGGNGTGKTTTMNLIGRIRKPYRGKILLKGKEIDKYPESELYGSLLGILPQNPQCLFVKDTVEQDLREMTGKHTDEAFLNDIIDKTEIRHLLSSHPYDLSGGEQQRAALAKVLLLNPEIILMDEPTKGMDGFYKQKLAGILKSLTAEGRTILMVSHDIEFCAEFGDTCALFFYGSIVTSKPAEEFFAGNSFYTTVANRIARKWYPDAVTAKDVIERCRNK